jgi:hypothetical protein
VHCKGTVDHDQHPDAGDGWRFERFNEVGETIPLSRSRGLRELTNRYPLSTSFVACHAPIQVREDGRTGSHKEHTQARFRSRQSEMATIFSARTAAPACSTSARRVAARPAAGKAFFSGTVLRADVAVSGRGCRQVTAMKVLNTSPVIL